MRNLRRRTRQGPAWAALALAVVLAGCHGYCSRDGDSDGDSYGKGRG